MIDITVVIYPKIACYQGPGRPEARSARRYRSGPSSNAQSARESCHWNVGLNSNSNVSQADIVQINFDLLDVSLAW
jgi:hypothetical protein